MSRSDTSSAKPLLPASRGLRRMRLAVARQRRSLSPARWFLLISLLILVAGGLSAGWWLSSQIKERVIQRTIRINALYIESFVAPLINDHETDRAFEADEVRALDRILGNTPLGREIVAFIVWGHDGRVLYSSDPSQIGRRYPVDEDLSGAFNGEVTWELNTAHSEEHIPPQNRSDLLLAIYSPVRFENSEQVAAVAEFYQEGDQLQAEIDATQERTWVVVGIVTVVMYLLLAGFIQRTSNTVVRQQSELSAQVGVLTNLLAQNHELNRRVRRATRRSATLNERFLRRISAELHDGPAQYIGVSLLHLGRVAAYHSTIDVRGDVAEHLDVAQSSLSQAMQEVRAISSGLGLPQLENLSLADTVLRAVRSHQRRTGAEPRVVLGELPDQVSLAVKVTTFRVLQESLTNAHRHAPGTSQQVHVWVERELLWVEVADQGPGFAPPAADEWGDHMGLAGMRERVESLGGVFSILSEPGQGTRVQACLPLNEASEDSD